MSLGTQQTPIQWAPGVLCSGTKSLRYEADHSLSSCANMASSGTNVLSQHPALIFQPNHIPEEVGVLQRDLNDIAISNKQLVHNNTIKWSAFNRK